MLDTHVPLHVPPDVALSELADLLDKRGYAVTRASAPEVGERLEAVERTPGAAVPGIRALTAHVDDGVLVTETPGPSHLPRIAHFLFVFFVAGYAVCSAARQNDARLFFGLVAAAASVYGFASVVLFRRRAGVRTTLRALTVQAAEAVWPRPAPSI